LNKNFNSYVKAITSGYAKTILTIVVGLWMVPFTLKFLTLAEYGVFAIAGDILIWLGLLQLGTGATLNSRAAQLIGKGDTARLTELTSTAFVLQSIAAVLMILVGGGISLTVDRWFQADTSVAGLNLIVFVLILGASIRITAQVFTALLIANKKIHLANYMGIGQFLLRTGLTVAFLLAGLKLMALAWAALISTVAVSVFSYWWVRRLMPEVRISIAKFRLEHVKDLVGNGVWLTIGGLAGLLILNVDRIMIGRFVSLEAVAAFMITGKLYFIAEGLHAQLFNVMRPYFGQLHGQSKTGELADIYHVAFAGSLLMSVLMASGLFLANQWFITWWVGPDLFLGRTINFLLALNFVIQSSVLPNRVLLASALFKMPTTNLVRVLEGCLNLGLSFMLVRQLGIVGVLLGSIVASGVCSAVGLNIIARSYFAGTSGYGRSLYAYVAISCLFLVYAADRFGGAAYVVSFSIFALLAASFIRGLDPKYWVLIRSLARRSS
jgi:O-antigen/teichoic acid export membrane protein